MVIGQSRSAVIYKLLLFTFFYILPSSDGTHPWLENTGLQDKESCNIKHNTLVSCCKKEMKLSTLDIPTTYTYSNTGRQVGNYGWKTESSNASEHSY